MSPRFRKVEFCRWKMLDFKGRVFCTVTYIMYNEKY